MYVDVYLCMYMPGPHNDYIASSNAMKLGSVEGHLPPRMPCLACSALVHPKPQAEASREPGLCWRLVLDYGPCGAAFCGPFRLFGMQVGPFLMRYVENPGEADSS